MILNNSGCISAGRSTDDDAGPRLGWRRRIFLVEASGNVEPLKLSGHTRTLETFCSQYRIKMEKFSTPQSTTLPNRATISTPFASPLFSGIFPGSPLMHSPERSLQHLEVIPPLSLDGTLHNQMLSGTILHSSQASPLGPRKLSTPVSYLNEKLQRSPQVGVVHLALQSDSAGLILTLVLRNLTFQILVSLSMQYVQYFYAIYFQCSRLVITIPMH